MNLKIDTPIKHILADLQVRLSPMMTHIPGCGLAIIKNNRLVWSGGFGVKNIENADPVVSNTVFEAASLSKPFIAYAALKMCELGELELDVSLSTYISNSYVMAVHPFTDITLCQVLSHSSGLPNHFEPSRVKKLKFSGNGFSYSGEGHLYLAHVIEQISHMSFADYMKKNVLDPLGLKDSSYVWVAPYETQGASPHDENGAVVDKWKPLEAIPSFSLHTTPHDFATFMLKFFQFRRSNSNNDSYRICATTKKKMLKPQMKVCDGISWGLGWGLEHSPQGEFFWHWGDNHHFKSLTFGLSKAGYGFVAMTDSANGLSLFQTIIEVVIGGTHPVLDPKKLGIYLRLRYD